MNRALLLLPALSLILAAGPAHGLSAEEVLKKVDDIEYSASDTVAVTRMELIDNDGSTSVRKMKMYQKGTSKRLIKFLEPADVKGMAFLDADDTMYLYLPAMHKIRRIAGHVKNDTFAGTDFSFDDLSSNRFTERLKAVSVKEEGELLLLTLEPKPDSDSQYGKLLMSVRKKDFLFEKIEFFGKDGVKWKVMTRKDFRKVGKYMQSYYVEMADLKKKHTTKNVVDSIEVDTGLKDKFFTKRQLKRK